MRNKPCSVGNGLSFAPCPLKTGPGMAGLHSLESLAFPSTMIGCRCKPEVLPACLLQS